jgi:uncharacterized DUF497 family protein
VEPEEAEEVVRRARPPYPLTSADEKFLVWGRTPEGKFLQVVFVMDEEDSVFIIHARPLTDKE